MPGAKGVVFVTLEDETDIANIIVWPKVFARNRRMVMTSRFLAVRGRLQRAGLVVHVLAESFIDLTPSLRASPTAICWRSQTACRPTYPISWRSRAATFIEERGTHPFPSNTRHPGQAVAPEARPRRAGIWPGGRLRQIPDGLRRRRPPG